MNFKREYTLIEVKDLKIDNIYGRVTWKESSTTPILVYLSKVFKEEDYEEITRDLNFYDASGRMSRSRKGSRAEFALYTELNKNGFIQWTVGYACDSGNGAGFIEVSRKFIPEMVKFMDHVDTLNDVSVQIQKIIDNGFPTILDALVRITGQKDLKKKIEKEPQLVKLFERIDDSLS